MMYGPFACAYCGADYTGSSSRQKHCSLSCRFRDIASKIATEDGCWEWPLSFNSQTGYGQFGLGNSKTISAHRMSWTIFYGPILNGYHVLHTCDNRKCINPNHLFLGDNADNIIDCNKKGRRNEAYRVSRLCRGDRHPMRIKMKLGSSHGSAVKNEILSKSGK